MNTKSWVIICGIVFILALVAGPIAIGLRAKSDDAEGLVPGPSLSDEDLQAEVDKPEYDSARRADLEYLRKRTADSVIEQTIQPR